MLAAVHISIWTAVKHDRKISRDFASQHGAHRDAGRYNKQLLRGADKLDDLRTLAGQIRQYFYKITLPWSDEGFRLLPSNFYFDLMARMREFEASFEQGVDSFLAVYPQYIDQVRPELNGLFREEDYPAAEKLREKFGVKVEILPIPSGGDFRVQMSAEEQARVSREIDANVRQSLTRGTEDLWKRLREVVSHMVDRLNEPESRFHASLVTTALLLDHPFFGSLLFRLKGRECRSIATMATDGVSLYYNPEFVGTLNPATLCGVLAHEVMHPGLHHHVRRSGRHPRRWNEACDYAINPILLDAGLHLPEGVLVDHRFREMTAEQIYNQLQTEAEKDPGGPDDTQETAGDGTASPYASPGDSGELSAPVTEGGIGQVLDASVAGDEAPTVEEQIREWSVAVNQAVTLHKVLFHTNHVYVHLMLEFAKSGLVPAHLHEYFKTESLKSIQMMDAVLRHPAWINTDEHLSE